jgi:hypothetical protein
LKTDIRYKSVPDVIFYRELLLLRLLLSPVKRKENDGQILSATVLFFLCVCVCVTGSWSWGQKERLLGSWKSKEQIRSQIQKNKRRRKKKGVWLAKIANVCWRFPGYNFFNKYRSRVCVYVWLDRRPATSGAPILFFK